MTTYPKTYSTGTDHEECISDIIGVITIGAFSVNITLSPQFKNSNSGAIFLVHFY